MGIRSPTAAKGLFFYTKKGKEKQNMKKKIGSILLSFVLAITMLPIGTISVSAARGDTHKLEGTFSYGNTLRDREGKAYEYPNSEAVSGTAKWMEIEYPDYNTKKLNTGGCQELKTLKEYRVNGKVAYCFEHGVRVDSALKLAAAARDKSFIYRCYENAGKKYIFDQMCLCLFYGRQEEDSISTLLDDPENGGLGFRAWKRTQEAKGMKFYADRYVLADWEAATRQLVHESQQGFRGKNDFKLKENGLHYLDGFRGKNIGKINTSHYQSAIKGQAAYDIYRFMAVAIANHYVFSTSIAKIQKDEPKVIQLKDDDKDGIWTAKVKVSEERAFALYAASGKGKKNLDIKLLTENGQSYYQVTYKGKPDNSVTYTVKKNAPARDTAKYDDMLIWECKDGYGHVQPVATGYCDPIEGYLKLNTKVPEEEVEPKDAPPPEPEYFPTFTFQIHKDDLNPGYDGDSCTPMGDATLAATFALYRDGQEVDRVTLDAYGSTATLSDQPWNTPEDFTRTESGSTATHRVSDGNGGTRLHGCGTKQPTKVEWEGEHTYEIREIERPAGRFIEPDSGVRKITIRYYAVTEDSRSYACEDANWSELQYDVTYRNPQQITDIDEQHGVITAVDETVIAVPDTFIDDCYRGKMTISKSLESENVFSERKDGAAGGERDSVNSYWKMRLASGGYENHPYLSFVREKDEPSGTAIYRVVRDTTGKDNAAEALKIGTNGDLYIYDIPYGRYIVEEYAADDDSFVKEQFEVVIDEHSGSYTPNDDFDNRYDYNLRDVKKTNKIKVVKTNAETGKQVRAKGTKFYIRYLGNPLNTEEENKKLKNYGRLLPNSDDITKKGPYTFEADENGEITIPYQLEYGIYRVEEWLLPKGYFVGEYHGMGKAESHDFETAEEGQRKALSGHSYSDLVGIYDDSMEKVTYEGKDAYALNEVFNFYTFKVEKQKTHIDGNFGQMVDYQGNISQADANYDSADYPYGITYHPVYLTNHMVKGKIEIKKIGEAFSGFRKIVKDGYTLMQPIYEKVTALKDAVFGIFAAEDILLNDGSDGPKIYDAKTGEEIVIPTEKSTHTGNLLEKVQHTLSKFFRGEGSVYETGSLLHNSGAKLWFLKDRSESEDGHYTRIYVSPEQKDTVYSYSYETEENGLKLRYDVKVTMTYQAGGKTITDVEVSKVSTVKEGYRISIPLTLPDGSVGEKILSPIESFLGYQSPDDPNPASNLSVYDKTYLYEADGEMDTDEDGNPVDLSQIGASRYEEKDYVFYYLTASDVKEEERIVQEAKDLDGDGIIDESKGDLAERKETKTRYEWENYGAEILYKTAGEKAVIKVGEGFAVQTEGYYMGGAYYDSPQSVLCDENGTPADTFTIPEGWSLLPYTDDPQEKAHHIIITKSETESPAYAVLLADGRWQECDENGNFQKMSIQVYKASYVKQAGDENGFSFCWDGFLVEAKANTKEKTALTKITKQAEEIRPQAEIGAGYAYEEEGNTMTFTAAEPDAPLYFLSSDGIRTEMYYQGGVMKVTLSIPQAAVDSDFQYLVPTLNFVKYEKDESGEHRTGHRIDWYAKLTPDHPVSSGTPYDGVSWKAVRHESAESGEKESYTIEIVSNQDAESPLEITYADGYTMTLYQDEAESGNGVGVAVLDSVYKTTRASMGALVDTITTNAEGKAVSKLLPLGKYIVRELDAGSGYVTDASAYEVELSYKNQFTPLVWKALNLKNRRYQVEIDLTKVFEKTYQSQNYQPESGAAFGIFSAESMKSAESADGAISEVPKDTLLDILKVREDGKAFSTIKLSDGLYYIKEIAVKSGYVLNDMPFYFAIGEDKERVSVPCEFSYPEDGIEGNIVMDAFENAVVTVHCKSRYPMPEISIDGKKYELNQSVQEENLTIENGKDETSVTFRVKTGAQHKLLLPNEKELLVEVKANTYIYTLDGMEKTYIPEVSYTGYYAKYTESFEAEEGESLTEKKSVLTLSAAGALPNVVTAFVKHTPQTKEELQADGTTKTVGILDSSGKQTYTHEAEVSMNDTDGHSVLPKVLYRKKGTQETEESISTETSRIPLAAGEQIRFTSISGEQVSVQLSADGAAAVTIAGASTGKLSKEEMPKAAKDGIDCSSELRFAKSVTLARQDHAANCLQIKINTLDDLNAGKIPNDLMPPENPPHYPGSPAPKIHTTAKDSKTKGHIAFAGKDVTIVDTVTYENLTVGQTYKLRGILMDKQSGTPVVINGKEVTAEEGFIPTTSNGTQEISFTFDAASFAGKDVVVFETLYKVTIDTNGKTHEKKTAQHEDLNDEGQTIHFPAIKTSATDEKSGTHTSEISKEDTKVTIVDTVSYENLEVGKSYVMKGILMDKGSKKPLRIKGKPVQAECTFIPQEECGTITLAFSSDAAGLAGKDLVVFECVYLKGTLIAKHTDINDKGQTVTIKEKPEKPAKPNKPEKPDTPTEVPKTGDKTELCRWIALIGLALLGMLLSMATLRKKQEESAEEKKRGV